MRTLFALLMVFAYTTTAQASDRPQSRFTLELEGGALFQTRNEVQIPNEAAASRIDLTDPLGPGPLPAARLYFTWHINQRHALRILAAPLEVSTRANIEAPLTFDRKVFNPGEKVEFIYRFNSYRLNYHYTWYRSKTLSTSVGFTGKIRHAKVELNQGDQRGVLTDLGFVPLLHLGLSWDMTPKISLLFDFNGLAGGPGRAFDVSLKLAYRISDNFSATLGYRTVEGGADVDAVYNFAWLHYAVGSIVWNF